MPVVRAGARYTVRLARPSLDGRRAARSLPSVRPRSTARARRLVAAAATTTPVVIREELVYQNARMSGGGRWHVPVCIDETMDADAFHLDWHMDLAYANAVSIEYEIVEGCEVDQALASQYLCEGWCWLPFTAKAFALAHAPDFKVPFDFPPCNAVSMYMGSTWQDMLRGIVVCQCRRCLGVIGERAVDDLDETPVSPNPDSPIMHMYNVDGTWDDRAERWFEERLSQGNMDRVRRTLAMPAV